MSATLKILPSIKDGLVDMNRAILTDVVELYIRLFCGVNFQPYEIVRIDAYNLHKTLEISQTSWKRVFCMEFCAPFRIYLIS